MMYCKLCNGTDIIDEYYGLIRDGGLGKFTDHSISMYRCRSCGVIWHNILLDSHEYYKSDEYRNSLEGTTSEEDFYKLHDTESLAKLSYTGTSVYRDAVVADIGCGCGAFLDYISGVAKMIVAIEPTESYQDVLQRKGFNTFSYASEALGQFREKVDVVTSFDVIEHVEEPKAFLMDIYRLLSTGGKAFIGTPTETPIMRKLLGEDYEKKLLFSTQHLWIFSKTNLTMMAVEAGFAKEKISFKYDQRYGIGNMLGWLKYKEPRHDISEDFITETLDKVWKSECEQKELSDYIILCLEK